MAADLTAVVKQLKDSISSATAGSSAQDKHKEALIALMQKISGEQLDYTQASSIAIV